MTLTFEDEEVVLPCESEDLPTALLGGSHSSGVTAILCPFVPVQNLYKCCGFVWTYRDSIEDPWLRLPRRPVLQGRTERAREDALRVGRHG